MKRSRENGIDRHRSKMYILMIHFMRSHMNATIVDLRYRMKEVLEALDRRERVNVLYHGKVKGVLSPVAEDCCTPVSSHPFYGMIQTDETVEETLDHLRGGRYRAL